jgi:FAD/FMN-containing dehydrogenase
MPVMTTFTPTSPTEVLDTVAWAVSEQAPVEILGQGSKRAIGRPLQTEHAIDLSALSGVTLYEPEELVLSARAGTPVTEIEALLAGHRQELAFEPMDYGPLFGEASGRGTIGGVLGANLAGPRRIKAGAARDHVLGIHAVSGRGEAFKSGGRVVKNVTGYDLSKVMAGELQVLDDDWSAAVWRDLRDCTPFAGDQAKPLWRVSMAPTQSWRMIDEFRRHAGVDAFYDWQGGLAWLQMESEPEAEALRASIARHGGGHATLVRASPVLRAAVPVFQPQPAPLAALASRLKAQFDPHGILNPGRMG